MSAHRSAPVQPIFCPLRSVFRYAHAALTCSDEGVPFVIFDGGEDQKTSVIPLTDAGNFFYDMCNRFETISALNG